MISFGKLAAPVALGSSLLALAACSSASPPALPGAGAALHDMSTIESFDTGTNAGAVAKVFVSAARSNVVQIYGGYRPNALLGEITDGISGPNGMAMDASGALYVANVNVATITKYAAGATKPSVTYRKDLTNPLTLAVGADGTLYAVNYYAIGHGSAIFEYKRGATTPSVIIKVPGGFEGLALDRNNNLYAGYNIGPGGRILKFAPGSKTGMDLGISLGFAGGLAFDEQGNLLACDQIAPAIDVFPPGATKPSNRITMGLSSPYQIAFAKYSQRLYVADNVAHTVEVYSYPAGTLIDLIQRSDAAYGVAVSPVAQ